MTGTCDRDAERVVKVAYSCVKGRKMDAWRVWWSMHGSDPVKLHTACLAALLSLGAPPHPEYLTTQEAHAFEKRARVRGRVLPKYVEDMARKQWQWNKKLNAWADKHGLSEHPHRVHGRAQFRKFYAAWLHACKSGEGNE